MKIPSLKNQLREKKLASLHRRDVLPSTSFRDLFRTISNEPSDEDGKSFKEKIVEKVIRLACVGMPWAIQFLVERLEGKAVQGVLVAGLDADPLKRLPQEQLDGLLAAIGSNPTKSTVIETTAKPDEPYT